MVAPRFSQAAEDPQPVSPSPPKDCSLQGPRVLRQGARCDEPITAPAAGSGVGRMRAPTPVGTRPAFGRVGRRGECSQHKHSIILPFFLLCLLC